MVDQKSLKKFYKLYDETYKDISHYVVYNCSNIDDVKDILQNIYMEVYKKANTIEDKKYIFGIAKNKLYKYYRFNYKQKIIDFFRNDEVDEIENIPSNYSLEKSCFLKFDTEEVWKYLKYGVCTCTLVLMIGVFAFGGNKVIDIKTENYGKNSFNINELDSIASRKLDAESGKVNEKNLESEFSFYNDLVSSDLLKDYRVEGIYIKDSNDKYNKLNNYLVSAYTENKSINLAFSKDSEPLRDYFFDDNGDKYVTINGENIKIYSYENSYMTVFSYNGVNFDIETSNIDINEFVNILKVIIK